MRFFLLMLLGLIMVNPVLARKQQTNLESAPDFRYEYEGHALWYKVIDQEKKTCMTRPGYSLSDPGNYVSEDLVIPAIVNDGKTEYTVVSIGKWSFCNCSGLTSVVIPETVKSIGDYAFRFCSKLTIMNLPGSVNSIGEGVFEWCSHLKSINLPKSLISIGKEAFEQCQALTEMNIPDSVTSIGFKAFYDCHRIESVHLPASLKKIGSYAFGNCYKLERVYYPSENPIESVSSDVFPSRTYSNGHLCVPKNAISLCKQRAPWENFKTICTTSESFAKEMMDIFYND